MKLSSKGVDKLYAKTTYTTKREGFEITCKGISDSAKRTVKNIEFDLDDFEVDDCVLLTLEEAKRVKTFLDNAVELHDKGVVVIQSIGFETIQIIHERIKKAEKENETE